MELAVDLVRRRAGIAGLFDRGRGDVRLKKRPTQRLARIEQLAPQTVVPGHYLGQSKGSLEAVRFTADYIRAFDAETARAANSAELIAAMKKRYPGLGEESSLELGAKVAKGEMKW